jgi:hypothetical protein
MWPWSKFRQLRQEARAAEFKVLACGMAAHGVYAGFDHRHHSASLVEVIALQKRLESAEAMCVQLGATKDTL